MISAQWETGADKDIKQKPGATEVDRTITVNTSILFANCLKFFLRRKFSSYLSYCIISVMSELTWKYVILILEKCWKSLWPPLSFYPKFSHSGEIFHSFACSFIRQILIETICHAKKCAMNRNEQLTHGYFLVGLTSMGGQTGKLVIEYSDGVRLSVS